MEKNPKLKFYFTHRSLYVSFIHQEQKIKSNNPSWPKPQWFSFCAGLDRNLISCSCKMHRLI